jgi:hypothetical protein
MSAIQNVTTIDATGTSVCAKTMLVRPSASTTAAHQDGADQHDERRPRDEHRERRERDREPLGRVRERAQDGAGQVAAQRLHVDQDSRLLEKLAFGDLAALVANAARIGRHQPHGQPPAVPRTDEASNQHDAPPNQSPQVRLVPVADLVHRDVLDGIAQAVVDETLVHGAPRPAQDPAGQSHHRRSVLEPELPKAARREVGIE